MRLFVIVHPLECNIESYWFCNEWCTPIVYLDRLRRLPLKELEFSDEAYQDQLPFHAKNTALLNVRNNLHLASPAGGYWNEQEHTLKVSQVYPSTKVTQV